MSKQFITFLFFVKKFLKMIWIYHKDTLLKPYNYWTFQVLYN